MNRFGLGERHCPNPDNDLHTNKPLLTLAYLHYLEDNCGPALSSWALHRLHQLGRYTVEKRLVIAHYYQGIP